jgi:hypothetical protein
MADAGDGQPRHMVYLGTFSDGMPTHAIIPREVWESAAQKLDAERARREAEAEKARLGVMQAARSQGRLKRALRAVLGRRMK